MSVLKLGRPSRQVLTYRVNNSYYDDSVQHGIGVT